MIEHNSKITLLNESSDHNTSASSPESTSRESTTSFLKPSINQKKKYKKKDALTEIDCIKESKHDQKYKTELCKSFTESNFCPYGNKCRFAHGRQELFDKIINCQKYKQKECVSYFQQGYCCYGSRCHFKHDERNYKQIQRSFFEYKLMDLKTLKENEIWDAPISQITANVHYSKKKAPLYVLPKKIISSLQLPDFTNYILLQNNIKQVYNFTKKLSTLENFTSTQKFNFL